MSLASISRRLRKLEADRPAVAPAGHPPVWMTSGELRREAERLVTATRDRIEHGEAPPGPPPTQEELAELARLRAEAEGRLRPVLAVPGGST